MGHIEMSENMKEPKKNKRKRSIQKTNIIQNNEESNDSNNKITIMKQIESDD